MNIKLIFGTIFFLIGFFLLGFIAWLLFRSNVISWQPSAIASLGLGFLAVGFTIVLLSNPKK